MPFPGDLGWVALYSLLEMAQGSGYEPGQVLPIILQSLAARADFETSMTYLGNMVARYRRGLDGARTVYLQRTDGSVSDG